MLEFGTNAPCQQEPARATIGIHGAFHRTKNIRDLLPFIEKERLRDAAQGRIRIRTKSSGLRGLIQSNPIGSGLQGGGCLADGPRTMKHHGGKMSQQLL
jgi:hypothetical protein